MAKTERLNIRVSSYLKKMIKAKTRRDNFQRVTDWIINLIKKA